MGSNPWTRKRTSGVLRVVSSSGLAQAQPMGGKDFITFDQKGSLSPFYECWVSILGENLTLPQYGHVVGIDQRSLLPTNVPFPYSHSTCRVRIQPHQYFPMPWLVYYIDLFTFYKVFISMFVECLLEHIYLCFYFNENPF